MTVPWQLLLSAALGIWLMVAPAAFKTTGSAADSNHLVGALVITLAVIAMAEVIRAGRILNVLFGILLIIGPWLLSGGSGASRVGDAVAGVGLIVLSLPKGKIPGRYGSRDQLIV